MKYLVLVPLLILALATAAYAEADKFLSRDGNVSPGSTYRESDGAVQSDKPATSPWETWEGEALKPERFEIPGPWPIKESAPAVQTLVAGPTFRNQKHRIGVGAGIGYVNSKWRFPFELSIEPT